MNMNEDYKPRFVFEISPEQQLRANQLLSEHGVRRRVFSPILDEVLDMIEEHGDIVKGIIAAKKVPVRNILPPLSIADRKAKMLEED